MVYVPRPLRRSEGATAGLFSGAPVLAATQWSEYAANANWTRGKGACLVPWTPIDQTLAAGSTYTFRFRVKTRDVACERIWCFAIRSDLVADTATITIKAPASTGTALVQNRGYYDQATPPIVYREAVASKATTETEITCDITAAGKAIYIESIACYEQDRAGLANDTTDYGCMVETIRATAPIIALENQSAYGVMRALANLDARRTGIYHFAVPTESPMTIVSATPSSVLNIGHPIQAQKLNTTAGTGSVMWSVYAKVSAGAGGTVAIATSGSSVSDSVSVTSTSFGWSTARAVSINCDDFDEIDGLKGGGWDLLTWTIAGDGTNTLSVVALSMWVDSAA